MEVRMLQTEEIVIAAGLSRYVFDACLRNRMEFTQTIPFVEDYISEQNLKTMCAEERLFLWGVFEQEQLVAVSGMQKDGMITMLYVLPQHTRKRYGNKLLMTMKDYAKVTLGLERVTVNATPAWTSNYFKNQGFIPMNPSQNMRVPFVPMHTFVDGLAFRKKERISAKTILLAMFACVGFATLVGSIFMYYYLFG